AERRPRKWMRGLAGSQPSSRNGSTQLRWLHASRWGPDGSSASPSTRTRKSEPSSRRSSARASRNRSGESEREGELLGGLERVGADTASPEMLREVVRKAMHGVHLIGPGAADDLQQLVEVAVVGEGERHVGAEDAPEARVLRPAGHQG